jgi:hypothetical protein
MRDEDRHRIRPQHRRRGRGDGLDLDEIDDPFFTEEHFEAEIDLDAADRPAETQGQPIIIETRDDRCNNRPGQSNRD